MKAREQRRKRCGGATVEAAREMRDGFADVGRACREWLLRNDANYRRFCAENGRCGKTEKLKN